RLPRSVFLFFYAPKYQTVRHERVKSGRCIRGVGRIVHIGSASLSETWKRFGERLGAGSKEDLYADIQSVNYRPEPVRDSFRHAYLQLTGLRLSETHIVPESAGIEMPRFIPDRPLRGRRIADLEVRNLLKQLGFKKMNGRSI